MKDLFSIRQVCKSCGLSRSTLMRLEERGLLTPAFINEETGFRWYDNFNVSRVMQIKLFLSMDMTYDDIALYYRESGNSPALLARMETKFLLFKRAYEEIKLRMTDEEHLSFEFVELPKYVCYAREFRGATAGDSYQAMYGLYHEAVEKGYRLSASEPLFVINKRTDFIQSEFEETDVDFVCCVPLEPNEAPPEAVVYPPCRAFSCLFSGNYSHRGMIYNELGRKVRELGLKPTGDVRVLGLVAPYTGQEISPNRYVSRLALPIER